ncbi:phage integrase central domain-containing protein [Telluria mixta]|uniref:phage integrase central domain-containing protein n=1 Tax=Telluria mixta TaxID=34071 RepID=UPI0035312BFA
MWRATGIGLLSTSGSRVRRGDHAPDVLDAIRGIERRGALEIANRQTVNCSRVFKYAIRCGLAGTQSRGVPPRSRILIANTPVPIACSMDGISAMQGWSCV